MSENPERITLKTDHGEAALVWVLFLSIVLFQGDPDLFDLICRVLAKVGAP